MFGIEEELKFSPIDKNGHLYRMQEWLDCVASGGFIDYDGFGTLATRTEESNIDVYPSQVNDGKLPDLPNWATHIVWYNR